MPSLADIPVEFLQAESPDKLLDWLDTLPLIPHIRTELLSLWRKATSNTVTPEQWQRARRPSPNYNGT